MATRRVPASMESSPNEKPVPIRAVPLDEVRKARGDVRVPVSRSKLAATRSFRRVGGDRIFGVLGILVLLFSLYFLYTWEKKVEPEPATQVAWPETDHALPDETIFITGENVTVSHTIDLGGVVNVTRIRVEVVWMDDVGDETVEYDTINATLRGPAQANVTRYGESTAPGAAEAPIVLSGTATPLPRIRSVATDDLDEAKRTVREQVGDEVLNGTGTWTLELRITYLGDNFESSAPHDARQQLQGECPEPGIPQVCQPDPGQTVTVRVTYVTFAVGYPAEEPDASTEPTP